MLTTSANGKSCAPLAIQRLALALLFACAPTLAPAQTSGCHCDFSDSKWEAYGTKAACAIFMHKGRTSCEVEFGGYGADAKVVNALMSFAVFSQERAQTMGRFLADLQNNDRDDLFDPKFLQKILLLISRGAYLRVSNDAKPDQIKSLDGSIREFLDRYSIRVSEVFRGKTGGFVESVGGTKFEVSRESITITHEIGRIVVVYGPPQD